MHLLCVLSVLVADILVYIPAVVVYCLYLVEGSCKKKVRLVPGIFFLEYTSFKKLSENNVLFVVIYYGMQFIPLIALIALMVIISIAF